MRKVFLILLLAGGVLACSGPADKVIREAEALLADAPDSALVLLDRVREAGQQEQQLLQQKLF